MSRTPPRAATGLLQFLGLEQQRKWVEGQVNLRDADDRSECLEQRFRYVPRFEKLQRRRQANDVLKILGLYGENCIPIPRRTERYYWSVSCLPSTSDKPLVRVNASWMELFTLWSDGDGLRGRFIVHLSDFTRDQTATQEQLDDEFLLNCAAREDDVGFYFPRSADMLIINLRGATTIGKFLACRRVLRGIRTFNVTHMNRGRNAYQTSHCYSLADYMLAG